jgi:hypothetical protein
LPLAASNAADRSGRKPPRRKTCAGAENLKLNHHLDYASDSQDGPPITGEQMEDGAAAEKLTASVAMQRFDSVPSGRRAPP